MQDSLKSFSDGTFFQGKESRIINPEWETEPDRVEFEHLGFPCLIRRVQHIGSLCGYVAVPPGHPWHGQSQDDIEDDIEIHGGLSYASKSREEWCHKDKPELNDYWWLGFDCAHAWDILPVILSISPRLADSQSKYRNIAYVTKQCEKLAKQALSAGAK